MPKIQTQKFVRGKPSLDSEGALMNEQTKEALGQSQLLEDKINGRRVFERAIESLETRITDIKRKQIDQKAEFEGLCQERSRLLAKGSVHADKDAATIGQLRYDLECIPGIIEELEGQLVEQNNALAAFDRSAILDKQKARVAQLRLLSKKLVTTLEQAVKINQELQTGWDAYRMTSVQVDASNTTGGSRGMLEAMCAIFAAEVERNQPRQPFQTIPLL